MISAAAVHAYLEDQQLFVSKFAVKTPTSAAAATAVGCEMAEIAKCVLMMVGRNPVLVITSGDTRVKSSKLKKACGLSGKVRLPEPDEVTRYTGYAPGAVSPFLLPDELPVLLDRSLLRFDIVHPAAGDDRSAVAIRFEQLVTLSGGEQADVCDVQTAA